MSSPFKLIQISDCHLFSQKDKCGYQSINPYESLRALLKEVAAHKPHGVLVTGDLSGDYSEQSYQHLAQLWTESQLNGELILLPGNHDDPQVMQVVYPQEQLWHSTRDIGDWKLICLNTKGNGTKGYLSPQQWQQVKRQVQMDSRPTLLAMHHHPLASGSWMDKHDWTNKDEFLNWCESQNNIKAMVYGHIHCEKEDQRQHIRLYACPSTCWQWQHTDEFGVAEEPPGFRILELAQNGMIETQVVRVPL